MDADQAYEYVQSIKWAMQSGKITRVEMVELLVFILIELYRTEEIIKD